MWENKEKLLATQTTLSHMIKETKTQQVGLISIPSARVYIPYVGQCRLFCSNNSTNFIYIFTHRLVHSHRYMYTCLYIHMQELSSLVAWHGHDMIISPPSPRLTRAGERKTSSDFYENMKKCNKPKKWKIFFSCHRFQSCHCYGDASRCQLTVYWGQINMEKGAD